MIFSRKKYLNFGEMFMEMELKKTRKRINRLNELSGTEWIKFTKTWFIHRPAPRENAKLLHPAAFPESLIKEFIFFPVCRD